VRPKLIVFLLPVAYDQPGLQQGVKDLSIQKLIPKLPDERLHITILPGTSWLNIESADFEIFQPASDRLGCKLRAVVRANVLRCAPGDKQLIQLIQDILGIDPPRDILGRA
jgi:hypothetical protein